MLDRDLPIRAGSGARRSMRIRRLPRPFDICAPSRGTLRLARAFAGLAPWREEAGLAGGRHDLGKHRDRRRRRLQTVHFWPQLRPSDRGPPAVGCGGGVQDVGDCGPARSRHQAIVGVPIVRRQKFIMNRVQIGSGFQRLSYRRKLLGVFVIYLPLTVVSLVIGRQAPLSNAPHADPSRARNGFSAIVVSFDPGRRATAGPSPTGCARKGDRASAAV